MTESTQMPSTEEIEKKYSHCFSNIGYKTARDRALPNSGDATNERTIYENMEAEDDDSFINGLKDQIGKTTPGV